MDWNPPEAITTLVLDDIFDRAKGWPCSEETVPLKRMVVKDGNINYNVTVDGIIVTAFEQQRWAAGVRREVSPNRMIAMTRFTGITITDAKGLLAGSTSACGLPSYGIDRTGSLCLQAGFPIAVGFPVDLARRQLMVCMGLIAEQAKENLAAWNKPKTTQAAGTDWDTAKKAAGVAGAFLGAFIIFVTKCALGRRGLA